MNQSNSFQSKSRPPISRHDIHRILLVAKNSGLKTFGGHCGEAALAMNQVLFNDTAELVAGRNAAFAQAGHFVGHVALKATDPILGEVYWDGDAKPKTSDEIASWGALDQHDDDYKELANDLGFELDRYSAVEVELVPIDRATIMATLDMSALATKLKILETASKTVLKDRLARAQIPRTPAQVLHAKQ